MFVFVLVCITLCPVSFETILKRKRELVALPLLSYGCIVSVNVLWLFLKVPWVGLQCVIVVFPAHTHLLLLRMRLVLVPCNILKSARNFY